MDHTQATSSRSAERYLLGELTSAERDEFETHYFDCPVCADDVESGAVFIDNARAVLRDEERVSSEPAMFRPTRFGAAFQSAAVAAVGLLCFTAYQNIVTIPHLRSAESFRTPEVLPAVSLLGMGSRAASQPVKVPARRDFALELEIPGSPEYTSYVCQIVDANAGAAGSLRFTVPISADQAKDAVRLAIPAGSLPPGGYQIVVQGIKPNTASPQEITRYPIMVQYQ